MVREREGDVARPIHEGMRRCEPAMGGKEPVMTGVEAVMRGVSTRARISMQLGNFITHLSSSVKKKPQQQQQLYLIPLPIQC